MESPAVRLPWAWRAFAWTGALLFALALSYFLFSYAFTFRETEDASPTRTAIPVDLALFTVFALHHSVFARERVRHTVARTVPAVLERSVYVWIASLLLIAVCALWQPVPGIAWSIPSPTGWLLYLVMAVGVWLSVRSAGVIDIWELAGVRQVATPNSQRLRSPNSQRFQRTNSQTSADTVQEGGRWEFRTTGPYGLVRHPIYLGWFLMVFGVPTMTGTRLVFALVSCAYLLVAIPLEERTLRATSDGKYDEYMKQVRWRLVPGLY